MTKKNTSKQTFKTSGQKFNAKSSKAQAKKMAPVETVATPEEMVASIPAIEEPSTPAMEEAAEPVEANTEQTMLADETAAQDTEASVEPIADQTMLADETLAQETAPEQITQETPAQEETAASAPETTPAQSLAAQETAPEQAAEGTPETAATSEAETPPEAIAPQSKVDPRLPPLGTLLRRTDRHGNVRCECTVEEGGFRYAGTLYKTLSAAAIVAAKDLGLKSETQNGFTFFCLSKPARRERPARNPLDGLERAWERYREHAQEAAKAEGEARAKVHEALHGHLNALFEIAGKAAA